MSKATKTQGRMTEPIATIAFCVRDPESINRKYGRRKLANGGKGLFTNKIVKEFENRVREQARVAVRASATWPNDPYRVARARVTYQIFDTNHDADAPQKLIRDALEGIAYHRDKRVSNGATEEPIRDGKGRRVEIVVELLELRSPENAEALRLDVERSAMKRILAKISGKPAVAKPRVRLPRPRWLQ